MKKLSFFLFLGYITSINGMEVDQRLYKLDSFEWMKLVEKNPSVVTPDILITHEPTYIHKQHVAFMPICRTIGLLSHAIIRNLQIIQETPQNDHSETVNHIARLCTSDFFKNLPEPNKKRIAQELLETKQVYPSLQKLPILNNIIQQFRH